MMVGDTVLLSVVDFGNGSEVDARQSDCDLGNHARTRI
jgi:hypothetical protein